MEDKEDGAGLAAVGNDTGPSETETATDWLIDSRASQTVDQAIDDVRVAWSPDIGSFSIEECESRLDALIAAAQSEVLHGEPRRAEREQKALGADAAAVAVAGSSEPNRQA